MTQLQLKLHNDEIEVGPVFAITYLLSITN